VQLAILVFTINNSYGQCGSTVNAGLDLLRCPGEDGVQLSAQIGGNAFDFEWEGDPTLDDPLSLTPTVTPEVTTEYTLAVYSVDPQDNLVINGDFEQGNTGFFSEYDFRPGGQSGPITPDGSYDITNDQVTVEVPELELELDEDFALPCLWDNEVFTLAPAGVPYSATEYSYSWTTTDGNIVSGSNQPQISAQAEGTYTLTLGYDNGNGTCSTQRSVLVERSQNQPEVELAGPPTLNCDNPSITISSFDSFVPDGSVFDWQTAGGNIITATDGPDITVIAPGTYSLTITSPEGCFATETFTIDADFSETIPMIAPPEELSCSASELPSCLCPTMPVADPE